MEIRKTAVFTKEDIAHAMKDFLKKSGYEVYTGTFEFIYEEKEGKMDLKQVECQIFDEENNN